MSVPRLSHTAHCLSYQHERLHCHLGLKSPSWSQCHTWPPAWLVQAPIQMSLGVTQRTACSGKKRPRSSLTTRSAPAGHEKQENNDSTKQGPSTARQSVVAYQQSGVLQDSKSEGELTVEGRSSGGRALVLRSCEVRRRERKAVLSEMSRRLPC